MKFVYGKIDVENLKKKAMSEKNYLICYFKECS